jgi:hypothetical protein
MSTARRPIWFVLFVATVLVVVPLGHAVGTTLSAGPAMTVCLEDQAACSPSATNDAHDRPVDEDCCPGGCTECGLMCCSGPNSVTPALISMDCAQGSCNPLPPYGCSFSSVDGSRIERPPRC